MGKIIRITTVPMSLGGLLKGQLKYMSDHFEIIGISSSGGKRLHEVGIHENIRVIPVEMTRKITPYKDLKAVWQLYKIFRLEKPNIVHTHTPKAGTLGMIAAFLAKVPHRLHTIAGLPLLEAKGNKRRLLDMVEKITYKCATKIYPNSFGLNDIIINNGYTVPDKLKVIGKGSSNGIDTEYFNPKIFREKDKLEFRKSLKINNSDFVYVFVGRLVKDKGINELIGSFKKINENHNNTKLVLVGNFEKTLDPLLPHIEKEISSNPNIISVGWQNDVRPYFAISDVLAFPSYREGFPNVVMQAGAMGIPSIVSDINGCNEIIINNENGIIIPPKNEIKLYESMCLIYKKRLNKEGLSFNSDRIREMIVERYDQGQIWSSLLNEYNTYK